MALFLGVLKCHERADNSDSGEELRTGLLVRTVEAKDWYEAREKLTRFFGLHMGDTGPALFVKELSRIPDVGMFLNKCTPAGTVEPNPYVKLIP